MTVPSSFFPGVLLAVFAVSQSLFAAPAPVSNAQWTPVRDEVYLQESGRQVLSDRPVFAVGVLDNQIYAGFGNGVMHLVGDHLEDVGDGPQEYVLRMRTVGNVLWVMTKSGLHRFSEGTWTRAAEGEFADICEFNGDVIAARDNRLYRWRDGEMEPWSVEDPAIGPIHALALPCGHGPIAWVLTGCSCLTACALSRSGRR